MARVGVGIGVGVGVADRNKEAGDNKSPWESLIMSKSGLIGHSESTVV